MRNKYNANFYEEKKYYNTNQNDTDNKLDNENPDEAKIGGKNDYPDTNVEFAESNESGIPQEKSISHYDHYPDRNHPRNLK